MRTKYTTESGAEYIIDDVAKTWERNQGNSPTEIRSTSGTFTDITIDISDDPYSGGIFMVCPPFDPNNPVPRLIESTRIVKSERLEE